MRLILNLKDLNSYIIHTVISLLRKEGFESIVYLDDFLLLESSKIIYRTNVQAHINLLSFLRPIDRSGRIPVVGKFLSNPYQLNYICTGHYALEILSDVSLIG